MLRDPAVVAKLRGTETVNREQTRSIVDAIIAYHRLLMTERHQNAPDPAAQPPRDITPEQEDNLLTAIASNAPAALLEEETDTFPALTDGEETTEFPSEADL